MARVAVLGSINIDLVVRVPALPRPGDTVLGDRLLRFGGGKGANQAVAAARLGAAVRLFGRVGSDTDGDELLRGLEDDRVDTAGIARDAEEPSGAALITVEEGGQNTITVAPGANGKVGEAEVRRLAAGLAEADVLVLQLEIPLDAVRAAIDAGRRVRAMVVLNAAPVGPLAAAATVIPEVDLLVVNEGEAAALSGRPVSDPESATAAAALLRRGARAVAVTLGAGGSVLWSDEKVTRVEAHPVRAVDATAAGDAFVGAVACALAAGRPLGEAIQLGNAAGAVAVTRLGARSSLPTLDEVHRLSAASS
ncbi:MAG: ribokinase [Candidatus Dormibacteraeota bacterium]|nr:ribokinase [Candidatus Dormibacteraeota bacterium]